MGVDGGGGVRYLVIMELSGELQVRFAEAALATYSLEGLGLDEGVALESLRDEMRRDFRELSDGATLRRRWENCGIAGTRPEDFAEHLVEVEGGRWVICGIRHLGMNLEMPFVQLVTSVPFRDMKSARRIYREHLEARFAMFRPKWVQVYSKTGDESEAGGMMFLVARAGEVMERMKEDGWKGGGLELRLPEDDSYYGWYSGVYDRFHAKYPEKRDWVQKNDLELMSACREDGALRVAYLEGQRIGLIAAEREPFLGHDGIYFVEILLREPWRGKGLGRAMQQRFVEECCRPEDIVWGLIDRGNAPSLGIARSNGRRVVRGEVFFKV